MLPLAFCTNYTYSNQREISIELNPDFYSVLLDENKETTDQNSLLQFIGEQKRAMRAKLPLFDGACDDYVQIVIYSLMEEIAEGTPTERGDAFVHLINASQNTSLSAEVRDQLLQTVQTLNSAKAFHDLDLSNRDLHGINLSNLDLQHVDFSDAHLTGANLQAANLMSAKFCRTLLPYANLSNANTMGVNMIQAVASWADMRNVDLRDANLSDALLNNVKLNKANMKFVSLENADLNHACLDGADLTKVFTKNTNLKGASQIGTITAVSTTPKHVGH